MLPEERRMNITIPKLTGLKADVAASVEADSKLPSGVKLLIGEMIEGLSGSCNGCSVTAVGRELRGATNIHITVAPVQLALTAPSE